MTCGIAGAVVDQAELPAAERLPADRVDRLVEHRDRRVVDGDEDGEQRLLAAAGGVGCARRPRARRRPARRRRLPQRRIDPDRPGRPHRAPAGARADAEMQRGRPGGQLDVRSDRPPAGPRPPARSGADHTVRGARSGLAHRDPCADRATQVAPVVWVEPHRGGQRHRPVERAAGR